MLSYAQLIIRKISVLFLIIALSASSSGCAVYHVYQIGGPNDIELGNLTGKEWEGQTVHSLAWGGIRQDIAVDLCQQGDGTRLNIEEFKVETNLGYSLLSVITLGFWIPTEVYYRCAKPPVPTGELE